MLLNQIQGTRPKDNFKTIKATEKVEGFSRQMRMLSEKLPISEH